jgi:hypothetical protein
MKMLKPSAKPFSLYLPPNFDAPDVENSSVAVCELFDRKPDMVPEQIIAYNKVWIGNDFFVGRVDVIHRWTIEFMESVWWMLERGIIGIDEQVRSKIRVKPQLHWYVPRTLDVRVT